MGRRLIADEAGFFSCDIEVNGPVLSEAIEHQDAEDLLCCVLNATLAVLAAQNEPWTERLLSCVLDFMLAMRRDIDLGGHC
jgi:hypothetical protein